jgi:transcriptional regulator with XRE-family HTH domain
MDKAQTWRELLGQITSDPQERQRIASALGINPVTLTRWATGKSNPRRETLLLLLNILPSYRKQLTELIAEEFPQIFTDTGAAEEQPEEIPSAFYARVINAYTTSPPILRASSVSILILQQILTQLDPDQAGMFVLLAQCVASRAGQKVHSLRVTVSRATLSWNSSLNSTLFLGAESQAGHALVARHLIVAQSQEEKERRFPIQHPLSESVVACPIILAERAAGSLCLVSMQPHYFTQSHLDLIKGYAELLTLAFEPDEFYNLQDIELGIMPTREQQLTRLVSVQQRITDHMLAAIRNGQPITRLQAEQMVWQELEEELLHLAFQLEK